MKMLKRFGPSNEPWGTPYKLDFDSDMILSNFTEYVLSINWYMYLLCLNLVNKYYNVSTETI